MLHSVQRRRIYLVTDVRARRIVAEEAAENWDASIAYIESLYEVELLIDAGGDPDALWIVPDQIGISSTIDMFARIGQRPALAYSQDDDLTAKLDSEFVRSVNTHAPGTGGIFDWGPTIHRILANPGISTGRALFELLSSYQPRWDYKVFQHLRLADISILQELVNGTQTRLVANGLAVEDETVKQRLSHLYAILNLGTRQELIEAYTAYLNSRQSSAERMRLVHMRIRDSVAAQVAARNKQKRRAALAS